MADAGGHVVPQVPVTISPPVTGTLAGLWNTGVATSGLAGADFLSIGAPGATQLLHTFMVRINQLTPAAVVTVRGYASLAGTEREIYNQPFTVGADPDLWLVSGAVAFNGILRWEVSSNNVLDDNAAIDYQYQTELA